MEMVPDPVVENSKAHRAHPGMDFRFELEQKN